MSCDMVQVPLIGNVHFIHLEPLPGVFVLVEFGIDSALLKSLRKTWKDVC